MMMMHFQYLLWVGLVILFVITQQTDDDDDQGGGMMVPSYQGGAQ
jgi:hypothetical protein